MSKSPKTLLSESDQAQVVAAIKQAELQTSGEIRVHIDRTSRGNAVRKAIKVFRWLKMHKTAARNGVLIYLAVEESQFAIIGDEGIDQVVPSGFWDSTRDAMQVKFKEGLFAQGLSHGIQEAGEQLRSHFPYQSDDVNELPDEISFGDD